MRHTHRRRSVPDAKTPLIVRFHEDTVPLGVDEFLACLRIDYGGLPADLHVSRMFSSLVAITEGAVVAVTEPYLAYCPLAASLYGENSTEDSQQVVRAICQAVATKVEKWGHYSKDRELCTQRVAIPFGASEMMMRALQRGAVDAAVVVCEGVGTLVTNDPCLVQGIGARMNGLLHTTPILDTMKRLQAHGALVVCADTARIDQRAGLAVALSCGYRRIAVTVNAFHGEDLKTLRHVAEEHGAELVILGICTTGIDETRARELATHADLVWSCASPHVRHICGHCARVQVAKRIPVFVMTDRGVRFLASYTTRPHVMVGLDPESHYLIAFGGEGPVLGFGKVPMHVVPVDGLPVDSPDSPRLSERFPTSI